MCGKPIRLFGTHRDTPNAHSTPSMQHIFTHKKKTCAKTHMYIFNAHTNMIHTWLMPAQYSMCSHLYLVEEFKKVFFLHFFIFSTIFSAIAYSITVCDVSQPLPLVLKRFSKTNISFLLRKLDPISFSSALLIKGRLGNLNLSNPKKEHGLSNNKLTHRVCIQYSHCCVS